MNRSAQRRENLRRILRRAGVDALLVTSQANVFYLTGFTGDASALLVGENLELVISDGRFTTQLAEECPELQVELRPPGLTIPQLVGGIVGPLGCRAVAVEAEHLSVADFASLQQATTTVSWIPSQGWVEELRAVKDEQELRAIREAVAIAEESFAAVRAELQGSMNEKEVADLLDLHMRRRGATGSSFPTIVAVGARSALPHARPSPRRHLQEAPFLLIDWGADGSPYKSDLTRMIGIGSLTNEFERIYQIVLAAQERAIAAIRPGVAAQDIDAEARKSIEEAGFGDFFGHGLGHGLGIEIHEMPRLRQQSNTLLQPGMVVTVEPGIYLPQWGGIRLEDDVLVTDDGREVLSSIPRGLDSVRLSSV